MLDIHRPNQDDKNMQCLFNYSNMEIQYYKSLCLLKSNLKLL